MTTRRSLSKVLSEREFDVSFGEGELGMRLEERGGGAVAVSVVVAVSDKGQARAKHVSVGCIIVGINGEMFLSHAHTVSTLKHVSRPVIVRFLRPASDDLL